MGAGRWPESCYRSWTSMITLTNPPGIKTFSGLQWFLHRFYTPDRWRKLVGTAHC